MPTLGSVFVIRYLVIFCTDVLVGVSAVSIEQVSIMHLKLRAEGKVRSNGFRVDEKSFVMSATRIVPRREKKTTYVF